MFYNPASLAAFTNTPGYQFQLQQGIAGLYQSAASKGGLLSGNQDEAVANYASGLASENFGNYVSGVTSLADLGENAAAQTGNYGTQTAANIGQTAVGSANAQAAGLVGTANAVTGAINSGTNAYLANSFLNPATAGGGAGIYGVGSAGLAASTDATIGQFAGLL